MIPFCEPRLQDLLADPIIDILMKRDGVTVESLLTLLSRIAAQVTRGGRNPIGEHFERATARAHAEE